MYVRNRSKSYILTYLITRSAMGILIKKKIFTLLKYIFKTRQKSLDWMSEVH